MTPHYWKYRELLIKLNVSIDKFGDNEKADKIREEMDPLWVNMSEEERKYANDFSIQVRTRNNANISRF